MPLESLPSLAKLAADALLQDSETALKYYRSKFSLHSFIEKIGAFTNSDLIQFQKAIQGLQLPDDVFIYTTGSDGKSEKSCRKESPVELIIVCDPEKKEEIKIKMKTLSKDRFSLYDDKFEYKHPEQDSLLTCICTNEIIPSRFLHRFAFIGSDQQANELNVKFIDDLKKMTGKDRSKFVNRFVKEHSKQMKKTLEGNKTDGVDLEKGEVSYAGKQKKATKYSLLRPIQYHLDLVLVDALRLSEKSQEECVQMIQAMPAGTLDQIDYMHEHKLLSGFSDQDIEALQEAYMLGLLYFQTAQHLFSAENKKEIRFTIPDKKELKKAYETTSRLLTKLRINASPGSKAQRESLVKKKSKS